MRIRPARFLRAAAIGICSLLLSAGIASAQDRFPSKPIQLVAPLAPGTTSDVVARILAERLSQRLGQPVVVQNRTGASGAIAGQFVAKSAPDGYTILIVNSQHSANPALFDNLPYDTLRNFTGVALFGAGSIIIGNVMGFLLLKQDMTLPVYVGVSLAICAFLALALLPVPAK